VEVQSDHEDLLLEVARAEEFIPRLLERLGAEISFVSVMKPSLNDVFLRLVGREIREEEATSKDTKRQMARAYQKARWRRR
jgi:ABC-2 type transport system ATP-binding protein